MRLKCRSFEFIKPREPLVRVPHSARRRGRARNLLPFRPVALVFRQLREARTDARADRQVGGSRYAGPVFAPVLHFHCHAHAAPGSSYITQSLRSSVLTSSAYLPRWSLSGTRRFLVERDLRTRLEREGSVRWRRFPNAVTDSSPPPRLPRTRPSEAYLRLSIHRSAGMEQVRDGRTTLFREREVDRLRTLHRSMSELILHAQKMVTVRLPSRRPLHSWLRQEGHLAQGRHTIARYFEKSVEHSHRLEIDRLRLESRQSSIIVKNAGTHRDNIGVALVLRDRRALERRVPPVQLVFRTEVQTKQPADSAQKSAATVKASAPPQIDVGRLSREVIRTIDKTLRVERERRGRL